MKLAIEEARRSRPDPGKFCVGAVLVNEDTGDVLSRGYYLEYPEVRKSPSLPHSLGTSPRTIRNN